MGILKVAVLFILVSAVLTEDDTKAKNVILPGKVYYKKHFIFPQKRRSFETGLGGLYGNNFNNLYSNLYNGGANSYGATLNNMQLNQQPEGNHYNGLHGTDFTNIFNPTVGNYNKDQNHQYGTTLDILGSGSTNGDYLFNEGNFDHQVSSFPTSHFDANQKQKPISYSSISGHKPVSVSHSNKGQFTKSPKGFDFNSHHDAAVEPITLGSSLKSGFGSGLSSQYGLSQYGSNLYGNFKSPNLDLVDLDSNAYQSSSPVLDSSKYNFGSTSPKSKGFENSYKKIQPTSSPYKSNSYPGLFQSFGKTKNSYKPAPVKYQFDNSLSNSFHSNHQTDNSFKGHNFQSNGFDLGDFNTFGHTFKPQDFKSVSIDHFKTNTDLTSFGPTNHIQSFGQQGYQFKSSPELSYSQKPFINNAYNNYAVTETSAITVPGYKEYGNYQTIKPEHKHITSAQLSNVKSPLFSAGKGASSEYGLTHDANGKMSAYVSVSHGDSNYNYSIKN